MDFARASGILLVTSAFSGQDFALPSSQAAARLIPCADELARSVPCVAEIADPCVICSDTIARGHVVAFPSACLGAGIMHAFHDKCLMDWFKRQPTCPTCRR